MNKSTNVLSEIAEMSPVFNKGENLDKDNCWPVGILSHMSKAYEQTKSTNKSTTLWDQNFHIFFAVSERTTIPNTLLKMMEIWKKHLNKGDRTGIILMDLPKTLT